MTRTWGRSVSADTDADDQCIPVQYSTTNKQLFAIMMGRRLAPLQPSESVSAHHDQKQKKGHAQRKGVSHLCHTVTMSLSLSLSDPCPCVLPSPEQCPMPIPGLWTRSKVFFFFLN